MPVENNPEDAEYGTMPLQELAEMALAASRTRNGLLFQDMMVGIFGRKDYMDAERTLCDTLLAHDELEMYKRSFELGYLAQWCKDNTEHVVRHCPQVLQ